MSRSGGGELHMRIDALRAERSKRREELAEEHDA